MENPKSELRGFELETKRRRQAALVGKLREALKMATEELGKIASYSGSAGNWPLQKAYSHAYFVLLDTASDAAELADVEAQRCDVCAGIAGDHWPKCPDFQEPERS